MAHDLKKKQKKTYTVGKLLILLASNIRFVATNQRDFFGAKLNILNVFIVLQYIL